MSGKFERVGPFLFLHKDSGFYYVRKSFKRLRIPDLFETTKEKRKQKALAIAEQRIAEHTAKYLGSESSMAKARSGKRISEIVQEILAVVTPEKRLGTQEMHKIYLGEIEKEWGHYDVSRFTVTQWAIWLKGFRERKAEQAIADKKKPRGTFDDYVKHMNLLLRYSYREKYTSHLVTLPAADKKREVTGRVYTQAEIKALWENMEEDTRDQFVLSYECMMRLREVLKLTWDRVDLKAGTITLGRDDVKTGSKTGKGRAFKASTHALSRLRARHENRTSEKYVFPSPTDPERPMNQNKTAWRAAKIRAGVTGRARWHDLRHSALSKSLLESGSQPILVSEYSGVSLRTIQKVYLHSTADHTATVASAVRINQSGVKKQ